MARPTKLSDRVAKRILDALKAGNTIEASAAAGPVGASTFRRWCAEGRANPTGAYGRFAESVELAQLEAERAVVAQWVGHFPADWRACCEFLARRFPERWRRTDEMRIEPVAISIEERAAHIGESLRRFQEEEARREAAELIVMSNGHHADAA